MKASTEGGKSERRLKNKGNLAALVIGVSVSLLLAEILLRAYPPPLISDDIYYVYDAGIGIMPQPNQRGKYYSSCFEINPILTNSLGFRDQEWTSEDRADIAVLGDSYVQGRELPEKVPVPQLLAGLLGIRTLNAGVSDFSTVNEYLVFRKYVASHKPRLVILFPYLTNDVVENSHRLRRKLQGPKTDEFWPMGEVDPSGRISIRYPSGPSVSDETPFRSMVKRYSKTLLFFQRLYDYYQDLGVSALRPNVRYNQIYISPETEEYREAWSITEFFLVQLRDEVEKAGGKLIVVPIPDYITTATTWKEELKEFSGLKELPEGFDIDYPVARLRRITEANQIPVIELGPFFREYRDTFNMKTPYFSYQCDGHLNPLAHFLAANLIAKHLLTNDIVSVEATTKERLLSKVESNLGLGPESILSKEGYDQIYNGGRFKGNTNIPDLVP